MRLGRALLLLVCLSAVGLGALAPAAASENNGVATTPPMGWNDWYSVYCGVSAQLVEQTAQAMVSDGLKAAGYDYVNVDDCWMASSRDSSGNLVADPTRFPGGIKPVADYVHGLGLKLGLYEDAGTTTCAHFPGSFGHEAQDAATFAAWGVDYVKYDRCNIPYGDFPGQSVQQVQQTLYARMSNALAATGRPIVFSLCNPDPTDAPWEWAAPIGNLWRTTTDIQDNFGSMLVNFEGTVDLAADAHPGAWNDPDLLQVGNGGSTALEYRSEFSLWAEMAAPLIASTNVSALSPTALSIYENREVIAVDQDPLGAQGVPISRRNGLWVISKPLQDGDRSVLLFNSTDTAAPISTTATVAGLPTARGYRLQNLWTGAVTESGGRISAFVPAHGVVMYRVRVAHRPGALPPHIALSLAPAASELRLGESTTVRETFENDGISEVKGLKLTFSLSPGWRLKRLGPARAKHVAAGHRFTVAFRITAPRAGAPVTLASVAGGASYDPPALPMRATSAILGERVFGPLRAPFKTADTTNYPASFGESGNGLAIRARGAGVFAPANAPASDSFAAIYETARAGPSATVQTTVTYDPAGGTSGGAGLIERNTMSAPQGSPAGVALFITGSSTIVMAWNAGGGQDVDSRYQVPGVLVRAPVTLRLVRDGATYAGYYSTNWGISWSPVDTVTVAGAAAAAQQDVGVFHASGLSTWTTTATFSDLTVH
ncbi:MAG: alpha-galactosidase [Solirubrobacterales bacterium]|nr:alpha-galactosidase [Solirubrobacterales bacterium]